MGWEEERIGERLSAEEFVADFRDKGLFRYFRIDLGIGLETLLDISVRDRSGCFFIGF